MPNQQFMFKHMSLSLCIYFVIKTSQNIARLYFMLERLLESIWSFKHLQVGLMYQ